MTAGALLAFETSTRRPSVALALGGDAPRVRFLDGGRSHARDLLPTVDALLTESGLEIGDVRALAAGIGPGSFTGLRVGVATLLGLERALGVPSVAVSSMAAAVLDHLQPGEVGGQLLDARGGRLYVGAFERGVEGVEEVLRVTAPRPSELAPRLADGAWRRGSRARLFVDPATRRLVGATLDTTDLVPTVEEPVEPDAGAVARLARHRLAAGAVSPPGSVRPAYLARYGA